MTHWLLIQLTLMLVSVEVGSDAWFIQSMFLFYYLAVHVIEITQGEEQCHQIQLHVEATILPYNDRTC